jgi:hypothetical protein
MSFFGRKQPGPAVQVGTAEGLTATGVYLDLVEGLKDRVRKLERDKSILLGFCGLLILAILAAQPLRKVVPFFYEVDLSTGRVGASTRVVSEINVSDMNIAYFLRVWAARVITINSATLREGLPSAYRWTRGGAATELDAWTEKTDQTASRIGRTPGLTREILGTPTVSFNESKTVAFIDLVWLEKVNGVELDRRRKLLSVEFGLLSAAERVASDSLTDDDNPLGLVITHFSINDQRTQ